MINWLVNTFVPDNENVKSLDVRAKYGILSGVVGVVLNVILAFTKLLIGLASSSVSITADAVNNFSDASASVVSIIGFKISRQAPDRKHPFGYGRVEYISGLIISFLILMVGFEFIKTSIDRIRNPKGIEIEPLLIVIMMLSVAVKLWLGFFNKKIGQKINSTVLLAAMQDSINDVLVTTVVIIGMVFSGFTSLNIDGYLGFVVAIFILISGFKIIGDTLGPLIGQPPRPELIKQIEDVFLSFDKVLGIHDLIVHSYGESKILASVHVEIEETIDFITIHNIIDAAEKAVWEKTGVFLVAHMDPVAVNNQRVDAFKEDVLDTLKNIDPRLSMHDFRMVELDNQINLIFDVVVPYDYKDRDALYTGISASLKNKNKLINPVIVFDNEM